MYFKTGSYTHSANEVDLTQVSIARQYSPRNRMVFKRHTLVLQGHLCVSGQADIKAAIDSLTAAYRYDLVAPSQGDAGLYHDNGTKSSHFLSNADSINGIRIMSHSFPKNDGAEYATHRNYSIVLQADYLDDWEDTIYSFEESMLFLGNCGPEWEFVPQFYGPPLLQVNFQYTPQRIVQRGKAVGIQAHPAIPSPLLPDSNRHGNRDRILRGSAEMIGRHGLYLFPVAWQYEFSLTVPSIFNPRADYPHI